MSVEAMAVVLHHSKAKGTAKLVLIGIANHDGDGGAWPTVSTLAKYAAVAPRNVQAALGKLASMGEIQVYRQAGGTQDLESWERPNRYEVRVTCPPWCDRTKNHRDTRSRQTRLPVDPAPEPVDKPGDASVTPYPETGGGVMPASGGGVMPASPKPSIEPGPTQVPASTTDRARQNEAEDRPPIPANPPADELAKIREQLRRDTAAHKARGANPTLRNEDNR